MTAADLCTEASALVRSLADLHTKAATRSVTLADIEQVQDKAARVERAASRFDAIRTALPDGRRAPNVVGIHANLSALPDVRCAPFQSIAEATPEHPAPVSMVDALDPTPPEVARFLNEHQEITR